jgi:hypothetical protein
MLLANTGCCEMFAGAVFEASLPPDLVEMYCRLAVLLPQAPVPLVMVLQLWGCTDPVEAQETVQIFVMQVCTAFAVQLMCLSLWLQLLVVCWEAQWTL